ncbi:hypothetical protein LTR53_011486 [Teratosphaeriaceae sp. CCFEE 6253]|nr:hypothetical protein LTR53_011486 [Teratosphaeriaceae sp. CCFEE 6253]
MSYARARAFRSLQSALRSSSTRVSPRISWTQLAVGRRYASGESDGGAHGHAEPSSDLPWLAGAVAVTVPSCWYLWPTAHADSGHHDAHGEHEEHEEGEGGEDHSDGDSIVPKAVAEALPEGVEDAVPDAVHDTSGKEDGAEAEGAGEDQKDDEAGDMGQGKEESSHAAKGDPAARSSTEQKQTAEATDKASGSQGEGQDAGSVTPSEHAVPKEGGSESGQGKGNMKSDSDGTGDERKREPDNKGGFKKRIDSGLGKNLGGTEQQFDEDGSETAAQSKPPVKGDSGQISSKQFGLSNTPTRHSTQIDDDPEKSKKAEGGPDTAKLMGTVDPNRPAK